LFVPFEPADVVGSFLEFMAELFDLSSECPSLVNEFAKRVPRHVGTAWAELLTNGVHVVAKSAKVVHRVECQ
jgi:hypothetical protein